MRHAPIHATRVLLLAAAACGWQFRSLSAADKSPVVAVIACDGYADVKKQIAWVGQQVGNPNLAGFAESFLLLATQGKGLKGLDTGRPLGIVVTAQGEMPVVHGFVPVKNLDGLLTSLQGVIGPAVEEDGVRRIAMPGGAGLTIVEQDGWAVVAQEGAKGAAADPAALLDPLVKSFSLAVQLFPSRMPDAMRAQLQAALEQAQQAAAAQGQPVDDAAMQAALAGLRETEMIVLGMSVDPAKERLSLDIRNVMTADAKAAALWAEAIKARSTISLPATGDGTSAMLGAHHVQAVPAAARKDIEAALAPLLAAEGADDLTQAITGVLGDVFSAMLDAGGIESGLMIDTAAASAEKPLPQLTATLRIADGPALENKVKARLGRKGALPPTVKAKFDAGKVGRANLHEIAIGIEDGARLSKLGDALTVTLAVSPDRAFLLLGGDVPKRTAAALEAAGKPDPDAQPITTINLSLAGLLRYAALAGEAFDPDNPQNAQLSEVAAAVAEKPNTLVQLLVRPIDRGVSMLLSADAGALQAVAALVAAGQTGPARPAAVREFELPPGAGLPALAP